MMTNCKNCGAPLHDYKCEYCGTEYEREMPIFQVETVPTGTEVIAAVAKVPLLEYSRCEKSEILEAVKHELTYKISEKLLDYMDVETWIDAKDLHQVVGGRVRVVLGREGACL